MNHEFTLKIVSHEIYTVCNYFKILHWNIFLHYKEQDSSIYFLSAHSGFCFFVFLFSLSVLHEPDYPAFLLLFF